MTKAFHMHMDPLIGPRITLRPMLASDGRDLVQAASDGDLWKLPFTVVPSAETIDSYIRVALEGRADGTAIPYVIQLHQAYEPKRLIIGSTRFWKIDWHNRSVEIGWTWLAKSWQRTFVNTEAKYLMLLFAFERLNCIRVQFMTDETNEVSCAAILRLGAKQEGIIRQDFIMPNGRKRDSVQFSIIDEEWPEVRRNLEERLKGPPEQEPRRNPVDGTPARSNSGLKKEVLFETMAQETSTGMKTVATLRVARPTDNLPEAIRFYRDGLGMEVLASFSGHNDFDGAILGHPGFPYHLEFTKKRGETAGRAPSQDNLLVFYLPETTEWNHAIERMHKHGYEPVASYNPWWDDGGKTFADPDGYRVVLYNKPWDK